MAASVGLPTDPPIQPRPISILVFGYKTPQGRALMDIIKEDPESFYAPIDIRKPPYMPRNPADGMNRKYKVSHYANSEHEMTQLALLDDCRFFHSCLQFVIGISTTEAQERDDPEACHTSIVELSFLRNDCVVA